MANPIVALIPLRGGSQGIPGKNVKPIAGKPLCRWSLEAACESSLIDRVYVSTDSDKIKEIVNSFELPVEVIDRPAEYATNTASTESVMIDFAKKIDFETVVTIQATSPLTTASDLDRAIGTLRSDGYDSMVTGVIEKRFVWSPEGKALNYDPVHRPRRQDWKGTLVENGAFYITRREILEQYQCRLGGKIGVFEMEPRTAFEIDEPDDWAVCESLLRRRAFEGDYFEVLRGIRLVVCDVDGTLTDGGMYYDANGEAMKKFNTRDAHGLSLLREQGIEVAIVTRENSSVAAARAKKIGIPIHLGVMDKSNFLATLCEQHDVSPSQVAMIGDDFNDIEIMQRSAFSACPADAVKQVRQIASYVATLPGGSGAVREICEVLIESR